MSSAHSEWSNGQAYEVSLITEAGSQKTYTQATFKFRPYFSPPHHAQSYNTRRGSWKRPCPLYTPVNQNFEVIWLYVFYGCCVENFKECGK